MLPRKKKRLLTLNWHHTQVKIKKTPIMDDFDPSLTKTELSGKDLIMDGELPMRNGRICEHDSPDDDDSYIGNKGKKCWHHPVRSLAENRIRKRLRFKPKGMFTASDGEHECESDAAWSLAMKSFLLLIGLKVKYEKSWTHFKLCHFHFCNRLVWTYLKARSHSFNSKRWHDQCHLFL